MPMAKTKEETTTFSSLEEGRRETILWFFSFLFPQRGKLLFFSSFVFARGKRNRGKRTKGRNSGKSRGTYLLLISSFGFFLPEEENKRKKLKRRETKRRGNYLLFSSPTFCLCNKAVLYNYFFFPFFPLSVDIKHSFITPFSSFGSP